MACFTESFWQLLIGLLKLINALMGITSYNRIIGRYEDPRLENAVAQEAVSWLNPAKIAWWK